MSRLETPTNLEEQTMSKLRDLVRVNRDSAEGFREAEKVVSNERLKDLFADMASRRAQNSQTLADLLQINGNDTSDEEGGSWSGQLHRWWLDLRGKLSGGDAYAVLAEAERGEDQIKEMYEDAIKETAGNAVNDVLLEQYKHVKKGHDTIRDLRDAMKDA